MHLPLTDVRVLFACTREAWLWHNSCHTSPRHSDETISESYVLNLILWPSSVPLHCGTFPFFFLLDQVLAGMIICIPACIVPAVKWWLIRNAFQRTRSVPIKTLEEVLIQHDLCLSPIATWGTSNLFLNETSAIIKCSVRGTEGPNQWSQDGLHQGWAAGSLGSTSRSLVDLW